MGLAPGDSLGDVNRFKRVSREGFNITDSIDLRFFKLLFYFINDEEDPTQVDFFRGGSSGLLSPTWLDNPGPDDYYKYNSAWSYLKSNYEEERADALVQFITLLSNISSESPWYFQSISGVDEALAREKWSVSEERKKISIKCLNDPVDHRIESLLSLYRSIVWSHVRKCEVLPANLRKFDMGMFIFSGPIDGLVVKRDQNGNQSDWVKIGGFDNATDRGNYKYIEFHNCEISLDSIKSGFGEMSNADGFEQEFTIDIYIDDCYEYEYNPFVLRSFGDFFVWDAWTQQGIDANGDVTKNVEDSWVDNEQKVNLIEESIKKELNDRLSYWGAAENPYRNIIGGVAESAINSIKYSITGGLGNIFGNGVGIEGAFNAVDQEISQQIKSLQNKITGNIKESSTKISRTAVSAATAPITSNLKTTGSLVSDIVDSTSNIVVKPALGTISTIEKASTRISNATGSYIDEFGKDMVSGTKRLGDIAYDSQVGLTNQIGKNRLNAKLGKL